MMALLVPQRSRKELKVIEYTLVARDVARSASNTSLIVKFILFERVYVHVHLYRFTVVCVGDLLCVCVYMYACVVCTHCSPNTCFCLVSGIRQQNV